MAENLLSIDDTAKGKPTEGLPRVVDGAAKNEIVKVWA